MLFEFKLSSTNITHWIGYYLNFKGTDNDVIAQCKDVTSQHKIVIKSTLFNNQYLCVVKCLALPVCESVGFPSYLHMG